MFTGIVQEVGRILDVTQGGDTRLEIGCKRAAGTIGIGASIACSGICLTVVEKGVRDGTNWFAVEASAETRSRTTLGGWRKGDGVNLEPAMRLGDELGGHIVSGHVDGVGRVTAVTPEGDSHRLTIEAPEELAKFIASKGSICVDGISLTVNEVGGNRFGVNIIPHSWAVTNLGGAAPGRKVNLEIDLLARYVARLTESTG